MGSISVCKYREKKKTAERLSAFLTENKKVKSNLKKKLAHIQARRIVQN